MHPVFVQAIFYSIVIILTLALVGAFLRGFFWTYAKVRTSFGKYLLVKIRSPLRDYFAKGWISEGFLIYKRGKKEIRISIDSTNNFIYRCLAVNWVDVDEEKNAICKTDYNTIQGFDSVKFSDLLTRALMRPSINSGKEKLVLLLLCVLVVGVLAALYLSFQGLAETQALREAIPGMLSNIKTTVTGSISNI